MLSSVPLSNSQDISTSFVSAVSDMIKAEKFNGKQLQERVPKKKKGINFTMQGKCRKEADVLIGSAVVRFDMCSDLSVPCPSTFFPCMCFCMFFFFLCNCRGFEDVAAVARWCGSFV